MSFCIRLYQGVLLETALHIAMQCYTYKVATIVIVVYDSPIPIPSDVVFMMKLQTTPKMVTLQGHAECLICHAKTTPIAAIQRNYRRKYGG